MLVSRRKIIQSISIVVGAAATGFIPGSSLLFSSNSTITNANCGYGKRLLKGILIGTGKRGMHFAKHALRHKESLLVVGLAEPIYERRQIASTLLNIDQEECFNDWKEIFSLPQKADVAIIAASNNYFEACSAALSAGYDVWVDRPVSMNHEEVVAINALASSLNRQLLYCYVHEGDFRFMAHSNYEKKPAKI